MAILCLRRRSLVSLSWILLLNSATITRGETQLSVESLLRLSRKLEEQQGAEEGGDASADDQNAAAADAAVDDDGNQYFQYDLTKFSLRFDKCQYVKMYDEELAQDADSDSPLALKHFVVYKLCPSDSCNSTCGGAYASSSATTTTSSGSSGSSDGSTVVYGKYTVPVDDYLKYTVENTKRQLENACKKCEEGCTDDAAYTACQEGQDKSDDGQQDQQNEGQQQGCGVSCAECQESCYYYQDLENSGYVDASDYIECQQLQVQAADAEDGGGGGRNRRRVQENQDDANQPLYIGPRCNKSGKIVIGVFSDERCWDPVYENVETLLGAKLSYHLLNESYTEDHGCLSCKEDKDNENDRDAEDEDEVNEMCEKIYNSAAKCETETGLTLGFVQTSREDGDYENQAENEFLACTFINSLIWNSYTETGEINVKAPQDEIIRVVTTKQTITLSAIACVVASTLALMLYLDRKIKQIELAYPLVSKGEGTVV
jgi:hypothetical protein